MPIVIGWSKLRLVAFHLGHTSYGGSKASCRCLSLGVLCRSRISGFTRGTSWPVVGRVISFFSRLGIRGREPRQRVMVWHRFRWWIETTWPTCIFIMLTVCSIFSDISFPCSWNLKPVKFKTTCLIHEPISQILRYQQWFNEYISLKSYKLWWDHDWRLLNHLLMTILPLIYPIQGTGSKCLATRKN